MRLQRNKNNPIVTPGLFDWRKVAVFNPGAIYDNGRVLLYERAAGSLRPFRTAIGVLQSKDGINFKHMSDKPVFTSEMLGYPQGSVQDARIVKIDDTFYMTYAFQPFAFDCWPTGHGVPDYQVSRFPEWQENGLEPMMTQSGIAASRDGICFEPLYFVTPRDIDDRDVVLFPEKINGKFALLRRPLQYVGGKYGTDRPGIWISFSEDLLNWADTELIAVSEQPWEGLKIGASTNVVKTTVGWLLFYHGVDHHSTYRIGAMILDLKNPAKIIARTKHFIMEPEFYYERYGLVIPNVIFPTGCVLIDDILYLYYGCCDTSIALATVPIGKLLNHILLNN